MDNKRIDKQDTKKVTLKVARKKSIEEVMPLEKKVKATNPVVKKTTKYAVPKITAVKQRATEIKNKGQSATPTSEKTETIQTKSSMPKNSLQVFSNAFKELKMFFKKAFTVPMLYVSLAVILLTCGAIGGLLYWQLSKGDGDKKKDDFAERTLSVAQIDFLNDISLQNSMISGEIDSEIDLDGIFDNTINEKYEIENILLNDDNYIILNVKKTTISTSASVVSFEVLKKTYEGNDLVISKVQGIDLIQIKNIEEYDIMQVVGDQCIIRKTTTDVEENTTYYYATLNLATKQFERAFSECIMMFINENLLLLEHQAISPEGDNLELFDISVLNIESDNLVLEQDNVIDMNSSGKYLSLTTILGTKIYICEESVSLLKNFENQFQTSIDGDFIVNSTKYNQKYNVFLELAFNDAIIVSIITASQEGILGSVEIYDNEYYIINNYYLIKGELTRAFENDNCIFSFQKNIGNDHVVFLKMDYENKTQRYVYCNRKLEVVYETNTDIGIFQYYKNNSIVSKVDNDYIFLNDFAEKTISYENLLSLDINEDEVYLGGFGSSSYKDLSGNRLTDIYYYLTPFVNGKSVAGTFDNLCITSPEEFELTGVNEYEQIYHWYILNSDGSKIEIENYCDEFNAELSGGTGFYFTKHESIYTLRSITNDEIIELTDVVIKLDDGMLSIFGTTLMGIQKIIKLELQNEEMSINSVMFIERSLDQTAIPQEEGNESDPESIESSNEDGLIADKMWWSNEYGMLMFNDTTNGLDGNLNGNSSEFQTVLTFSNGFKLIANWYIYSYPTKVQWHVSIAGYHVLYNNVNFSTNYSPVCDWKLKWFKWNATWSLDTNTKKSFSLMGGFDSAYNYYITSRSFTSTKGNNNSSMEYTLQELGCPANTISYVTATASTYTITVKDSQLNCPTTSSSVTFNGTSSLSNLVSYYNKTSEGYTFNGFYCGDKRITDANGNLVNTGDVYTTNRNGTFYYFYAGNLNLKPVWTYNVKVYTYNSYNNSALPTGTTPYTLLTGKYYYVNDIPGIQSVNYQGFSSESNYFYTDNSFNTKTYILNAPGGTFYIKRTKTIEVCNFKDNDIYYSTEYDANLENHLKAISIGGITSCQSYSLVYLSSTLPSPYVFENHTFNGYKDANGNTLSNNEGVFNDYFWKNNIDQVYCNWISKTYTTYFRTTTPEGYSGFNNNDVYPKISSTDNVNNPAQVGNLPYKQTSSSVAFEQGNSDSFVLKIEKTEAIRKHLENNNNNIDNLFMLWEESGRTINGSWVSYCNILLSGFSLSGTKTISNTDSNENLFNSISVLPDEKKDGKTPSELFSALIISISITNTDIIIELQVFGIRDNVVFGIKTNPIVTFNGNGGTSSLQSKNVMSGSTYGDLPTATRTGYRFDGWYTATSGGTEIESGTSVSITANQTLYARWTAKTYTVTFNGNGGTSSLGLKSVTYNSTYGDLPTATRTGYTFAGWYTATSGGTKIESGTSVSITANQTLYARWTAKTYIVTFNGNGGTPTYNSKSVTFGTALGTLPTVTRTGYTFDGWYTAASGGRINTSGDIMNTEGGTLYAHWTANTYTVIFNGNGETSGEMNSQNYVYGMAQSLSANTFAKTDRTFLGWSRTATATSATYKNGVSVSNLTSTNNGTVILYAVWGLSPVDYSIKVYMENQNGGTHTNTDTLTGYSADATTSISYEDYIDTPIGFHVNESMSQSISSLSSINDCIINIYYDRNEYTIRFNGNGSTRGTMNTQSRLFGDGNALYSNAFEKTGYTYLNWNILASGMGTSYVNQATTDLTTQNNAIIELYAQWTANEYVVTFNNNESGKTKTDGTTYSMNSVYDEKDVTYDSSYGELPIPTLEGYTFVGWYTATSGGTKIESGTRVAITANQTLYAHWEVEVYNIVLNLNNCSYGIESAGIYETTYTIEDMITINTATPPAGYLFDGWTGTEVPSATQVITIVKGSRGDRTFIANTSPITYTVNYNSNVPAGYSCTGTTLASSHTYDTSKALTQNGYIVNGWYFIGWGTTLAATEVAYNNGQEVINLTDTNENAIELYAIWSKIQYRIRFYSNAPIKAIDETEFEVFGIMIEQTKIFDDNQEVTGNAFVIPGFTFENWNTEADGTGTSYANQTTTNLTNQNNAIIELYAQWTANEYVVTFNHNESGMTKRDGTKYIESTTTQKNVTYDSTYGELPSLTMEGYEFEGWYTAVSGGDEITSATQVEITANQILYAQWTEIEYTITYTLDGGEIENGTNIERYTISTLSRINNPIKADNTFAGWTGTGILSSTRQLTINRGTIGNLTFTATWHELYYLAISYKSTTGETLTKYWNGSSWQTDEIKVSNQDKAITYSTFTVYGMTTLKEEGTFNSYEAGGKKYRFVEWKDQSDEIVAPGETYNNKNLTGNTILTAQYEETVMLTFKLWKETDAEYTEEGNIVQELEIAKGTTYAQEIERLNVHFNGNYSTALIEIESEEYDFQKWVIQTATPQNESTEFTNATASSYTNLNIVAYFKINVEKHAQDSVLDVAFQTYLLNITEDGNKENVEIGTQLSELEAYSRFVLTEDEKIKTFVIGGVTYRFDGWVNGEGNEVQGTHRFMTNAKIYAKFVRRDIVQMWISDYAGKEEGYESLLNSYIEKVNNDNISRPVYMENAGIRDENNKMIEGVTASYKVFSIAIDNGASIKLIKGPAQKDPEANTFSGWKMYENNVLTVNNYYEYEVEESKIFIADYSGTDYGAEIYYFNGTSYEMWNVIKPRDISEDLEEQKVLTLEKIMEIMSTEGFVMPTVESDENEMEIVGFKIIEEGVPAAIWLVEADSITEFEPFTPTGRNLRIAFVYDYVRD